MDLIRTRYLRTTIQIMYPAIRARQAIRSATAKNREVWGLFEWSVRKKDLLIASCSNWKPTWEILLIFPVRNAGRDKLTKGSRFQDSMSARRRVDELMLDFGTVLLIALIKAMNNPMSVFTGLQPIVQHQSKLAKTFKWRMLIFKTATIGLFQRTRINYACFHASI